MTVAPTVTETTYALVGTNLGPFATVWPYAADIEVAVFVTVDDVSTHLTLNTDYTLTGATPLTNGGQVMLTAGLAGVGWAPNASLCLARVSATGQPSALGQAIGFSPKGYESALDFPVRQIQDLWGPARRALSMSPGGSNFNAQGHRVRHMADGQVGDDAATFGQMNALVASVQAQVSAWLAGSMVATVPRVAIASAFGFKGDGVADDSDAIQRTLDAAGVGGVALIPSGTCKLTKTLNGYANQQIIGGGANNTIFSRTGDYGDTLNFVNAGSARVSGIWFKHDNLPAQGSIALNNRIVTATSHINVQTGQYMVIEDCWLQRMPYQISLHTGALLTIRRCNMSGVWDPTYAAMQEGVAGVAVGRSGYIQLVTIEDCYFGGSGSAARNATFHSSDTGDHVFNFVADIGNLYGIEVLQCEGLVVSRNYLGGNSANNLIANFAAAATVLEWRIVDNFFDGAGLTQPLVAFTCQADGPTLNGLVISGNHFNGELQTLQGITVQNPHGTTPLINNAAITGNTFMATVGSAIMLYHARAVSIDGNTITGYNARNASAGGDLTFTCAAWASASASIISASNNIVGGQVNTSNSPSFCYRGIQGNIFEQGTIFAGAGAAGAQLGRVDKTLVTIDGATTAAYQMTGFEKVVRVANTTASVQIVPPANPAPGFTFIMKDVVGNAAARSTQFAGTLDGAVNPIFSTAWFTREVMFNGVSWDLIGN